MATIRTNLLRAMSRRMSSLRNFSRFRALIETPGSLADGLVMPANSRLGVSTTEDTDPGALLVAVNNAEVAVGGGPAGMVFRLPYVEKDKLVTVAPSAPGVVSLYVLDEWNRPYLIATQEA